MHVPQLSTSNYSSDSNQFLTNSQQPSVSTYQLVDPGTDLPVPIVSSSRGDTLDSSVVTKNVTVQLSPASDYDSMVPNNISPNSLTQPASEVVNGVNYEAKDPSSKGALSSCSSSPPLISNSKSTSVVSKSEPTSCQSSSSRPHSTPVESTISSVMTNILNKNLSTPSDTRVGDQQEARTASIPEKSNYTNNQSPLSIPQIEKTCVGAEASLSIVTAEGKSSSSSISPSCKASPLVVNKAETVQVWRDPELLKKDERERQLKKQLQQRHVPPTLSPVSSSTSTGAAGSVLPSFPHDLAVTVSHANSLSCPQSMRTAPVPCVPPSVPTSQTSMSPAQPQLTVSGTPVLNNRNLELLVRLPLAEQQALLQGHGQPFLHALNEQISRPALSDAVFTQFLLQQQAAIAEQQKQQAAQQQQQQAALQTAQHWLFQLYYNRPPHSLNQTQVQQIYSNPSILTAIIPPLPTVIPNANTVSLAGPKLGFSNDPNINGSNMSPFPHQQMQLDVNKAQEEMMKKKERETMEKISRERKRLEQSLNDHNQGNFEKLLPIMEQHNSTIATSSGSAVTTTTNTNLAFQQLMDSGLPPEKAVEEHFTESLRKMASQKKLQNSQAVSDSTNVLTTSPMWPTLNSQTLIAMSNANRRQQLIDADHLQKAEEAKKLAAQAALATKHSTSTLLSSHSKMGSSATHRNSNSISNCGQVFSSGSGSRMNPTSKDSFRTMLPKQETSFQLYGLPSKTSTSFYIPEEKILFKDSQNKETANDFTVKTEPTDCKVSQPVSTRPVNTSRQCTPANAIPVNSTPPVPNVDITKLLETLKEKKAITTQGSSVTIPNLAPEGIRLDSVSTARHSRSIQQGFLNRPKVTASTVNIPGPSIVNLTSPSSSGSTTIAKMLPGMQKTASISDNVIKKKVEEILSAEKKKIENLCMATEISTPAIFQRPNDSSWTQISVVNNMVSNSNNTVPVTSTYNVTTAAIGSTQSSFDNFNRKGPGPPLKLKSSQSSIEETINSVVALAGVRDQSSDSLSDSTNRSSPATSDFVSTTVDPQSQRTIGFSVHSRTHTDTPHANAWSSHSPNSWSTSGNHTKLKKAWLERLNEEANAALELESKPVIVQNNSSSESTSSSTSTSATHKTPTDDAQSNCSEPPTLASTAADGAKPLLTGRKRNKTSEDNESGKRPHLKEKGNMSVNNVSQSSLTDKPHKRWKKLETDEQSPPPPVKKLCKNQHSSESSSETDRTQSPLLNSDNYSDCANCPQFTREDTNSTISSELLVDVQTDKILNEVSREELMKSGDQFLQDDMCKELGSKLQKCRECRKTLNSSASSESGTENQYCCFYAFRKLKYNQRAHPVVTVFSSLDDATYDDVGLWVPQYPVGSPFIDTKTALHIMDKVSSTFCQLVDQEMTARKWANKQGEFAWKQAVRNSREMCDVCNTTLFNVHWTCPKCGFVVCIDCYRDKLDEPPFSL